jgi:hypothetical protein
MGIVNARRIGIGNRYSRSPNGGSVARERHAIVLRAILADGGGGPRNSHAIAPTVAVFVLASISEYVAGLPLILRPFGNHLR